MSHENGKWFKNDESFIFTLTNIHGPEPTKFPHNKGEDSIKHHKNQGPTFDDFYIEDDYSNSQCTIYFPRGHKDILGKGKSIFSGDSNNNVDKTKIKDIEVFQVFK